MFHFGDGENVKNLFFLLKPHTNIRFGRSGALKEKRE